MYDTAARPTGGEPIYISRLSLLNFRNYESLELELEPGMVLLHGGNGQGKSNVLEALYLLAIVKSPRASADRELVRWQALESEAHAQVSAVAQRDAGHVRVQIDFRTVSPTTRPDEGPVDDPEEGHRGPKPVQKCVRVNGVPRRGSDAVGEVNAVMFSAQDLELVLGRPTVRRRYMDILISQLDNRYLRDLQRYQRVVSQRNHLLKAVRQGRSHPGELDFWDDELVETGRYVMARRVDTVRLLSDIAGPVHGELTGNGETVELAYRPSVEIGSGASEDELDESLRKGLEINRPRELAQGFTVCGPHRDDLQMLLDGMDAGVYASRGQCRTVVLAMKLAEARYLSEQRGQEPVLLLDDVLSELDATRRSHVLDRASAYQQCFITSADVDPIGQEYLSRMSRFAVGNGRVEPHQ